MPIRCPSPPPDDIPELIARSVEPNTRWFRVGSDSYPIEAWDDRRNVNHRFSPLRDPKGALVPVSYLGASPDVALLETVLRFTPEGGGGHVARSHYIDKRLAEVRTTRSLQLIKLYGPEARMLGENWAVAISQAFASDYTITQQWAAWFFKTFGWADGIEWISHQEGQHTAILLWRRSPTEETAPVFVRDGPLPINSEPVFSKLCDLANRSGHTIDFS